MKNIFNEFFVFQSFNFYVKDIDVFVPLYDIHYMTESHTDAFVPLYDVHYMTESHKLIKTVSTNQIYINNIYIE